MAANTSQPAVLTQINLLQWLVHLRGEESALPASATHSDYAAWARKQGIEPSGGWQMDQPVKRDLFLQTLAQLLGLSQANSGNPKALETALVKAGVVVPAGDPISPSVMVSVFDELGFQSPTANCHRHPGSPRKGNNGVGNGEDPQPPGNPPINDGPGTGPGNPGNRGRR
jgi:hypothetical protein